MLLIGPRNASEGCIRNLYATCLYLIYTVLNFIEISKPITKFATVKIRFGVIYPSAIVSACDMT